MTDTNDDGTITLADGTVISMTTGRPVRDRNGVAPGYVAVPTNTEAVREVTRARRRIADLPDTPERMNIISCVASYYLFGLSDFEIAHALNVTEQQVGNIKTTDAFNKLIEAMTESIVEGGKDDVRMLIEQNARNAVQNIVTLMSSDDEKVAVVAAKDILDRAGHRPSDVVEHRHRIEGGLTIEYVRKNADDAMPVLTLEPTDFDRQET